ncbi:hypothetical protein KKB11_01275, partial [Candidatus Micrarchaeota archaeon]|nr:hypothetical protein [Candidatus Micrarchaeota archaeon]
MAFSSTASFSTTSAIYSGHDTNVSNVVLNKKILDKISQVDTLVFDIDGVLIDMRESFRKAI